MLLIFDLDGTLIDSWEDLAAAINAMREHLRLPHLPPELIRSYVGNGAATLVRRALGPEASDEEVSAGLRFFLDYYGAHAVERTRLYHGVRDALLQLSSGGHALAVLTNKPSAMTADILRAFDIEKLFFQVLGGDSLPEKKPDPMGIETLRTASGIGPDRTWMIGDSSVDVQTARNARVRACGVAWGFQPEGFAAFPPDHLVQSPADWLSLFTNSSPV